MLVLLEYLHRIRALRHTLSSGHGGCYRFFHVFMGYWSQIQTDREQINTQELLLLLPISCSRDIPAPWTSLSGDSRAGAEGGSGTALTLQPDTVTRTHGLITQFVTLNRNTSGAPGQAAALSWQGQGGDEEPGRVSSS